jgi:type I restriction enzyme S subunit
MIDAPLKRKAFGVWFKGLRAWSVGSFFDVGWHWPTEFIRPLSDALNKKHVEVDLRDHPFDSLTLATLHFDGTMEPRDLHGKTTFKGKLHFADAGDVIYSKIDVRNGAIGVVPEEMTRVAVSGEYPVYHVLPGVALAEYIRLVFRTRYFRQAINSMISGASGRKRVQPKQIESLEIPLPPLDVQRAIVARWQQARQEIAEAEARIKQLEAEIDARFFSDLGLKLPQAIERPKVFAVQWKDAPKWGVRFVTDVLLGLDQLPPCAFPYTTLGATARVTYGIQKSPANRPGKHARPYLRVANVKKGYLDLSEIKTIEVADSEMNTFRLEPGDILFVEGNGSRAELGRVGMWRGEIPDCVHQNHLIKVRLDQTRLLPEYAMTWFNTEVGRGHFFRSAKTSSGLGTINSDEVRSAPIPLPPLDVQRDIMRQVAAGRAEIARERAAAQQRAHDIEEEIEALILGTKTV